VKIGEISIFRIAQVLLLLLLTLSLTGCFFNFLQTARTVGAGNTALTLGLGAILNADNPSYLTPQGRLIIGVSKGIDLGVQSGAMIGIGAAAGDVDFLGVTGDLKIALVSEPNLLVAIGAGGGYSHDGYINKNGWGLSFSGYFEPIFPHVPDLSCCLGYRLQLPLEARNESDSMVCHQVTVSMALFVSDQARVIVEFGKLLSKKLYSFAIALEVTLSK